jgi:tryptophan 2,3-dioxygenase
MIENALGLRSSQRLSYGGRTGYCSVLNEADAAAVLASEGTPSLFQLMEAWLERTPFLELKGGGGGAAPSGASNEEGFSFWEHYRSAVEAMLAADEVFLRANSAFTPAALESHSKDLSSQREHFQTLLDPEKYAASVERGERRLSHRATQAALMITLFQREPGLHLPYRFINALMEIDEQLCAWRARHAQMVHRMLGAKLGTGGSSGYSYLKATVDRHRIFTDLFNLSTFLIPASMLPPLPPGLTQRLGFNFSVQASQQQPPPALSVQLRSLQGSEGTASGGGGGNVEGAAVPPRCPFGHG